jgi:PmbA protein
LADDALKAARSLGADAADVLAVHSTEVEASCRLGQVEGLERSESVGLGLRVFIGRRVAVVSTNELTVQAVRALAERAMDMARVAPEDPFLRLAEPEEHGKPKAIEGIFSPEMPEGDALLQTALSTEEAARAVAGIRNSEGASASASRGWRRLLTSRGFDAEYATSLFSLSCSVLAGPDDAMQRDYDYALRRSWKDLPTPEAIGQEAARRTLARVGANRVPSGTYPIMLDPRVARGLVGSLAGAINGSSIARGTSFLKGDRERQLFHPSIHLMDDPLRPGGLASRPFDAEGLGGIPRAMIEDGCLHHWFLDISTATQLGMKSTAHASRGLSGSHSPSPTNLYLAAGEQSPEAMMAEIGTGLYVTEGFGSGLNTTTGDYSQGVAGFMIRQGKLAEPVHELTIAGDMRTLFPEWRAANDLRFEFGTNSPTLYLGEMTVAGAQ